MYSLPLYLTLSPTHQRGPSVVIALKKPSRDSSPSLNQAGDLIGYRPPETTKKATSDMSGVGPEHLFLILQFLEEENFKETLHKLEEESGIYFSMKHFEELTLEGRLDEAERYLSGFTKMEDNRFTMKIIFEIRKQKFLETLDRNDKAKALDILQKELKAFSRSNEELYKDMAILLTMENFREHEQLGKYGDINTARQTMVVELKKLIEVNPALYDKLQFPNIKSSRLRYLINQSLNWQHSMCKNSRVNPEIKTIYVDHACPQPNTAQALPPPPSILNSMQRAGIFSSRRPYGSGQPPIPLVAPPTSHSGWKNNAAPMPPYLSVAGSSLGGPSANTTLSKRPLTPTNNPSCLYRSAATEHVAKRLCPPVTAQEAGLPSVPSVAWTQESLNELPKTVVMTLSQGSPVASMDFHPVEPTVLLVGTKIGDVTIWDISSKERITHRGFDLWDGHECSDSLKAALTIETTVSVNCVRWNADGSQCAIAYSKHLLQLFTYTSHCELLNHLQVEAHLGGVNDVAFSQLKEQQFVITCGDDKSIKVWDAFSGVIQYHFEGHETSVCSILPHIKATCPFIFSTSSDGKINAWFYENGGPKVSYTAPDNWCHSTMAYTADETRLFSCGTTKEGTSSLVEWNDVDGTIKRVYDGLSKRSRGVIHFDLSKNKYIAVGDAFMVKFWNMNSPSVLTSTDAQGGLEVVPHVRFNKNGSLLAVSTNSNGIKILANADGQLLVSLENRPYIATRNCLDSNSKNDDNQYLMRRKHRINGEILKKSKIRKLTEISEPSQLRCLLLPDDSFTAKIPSLTYANNGHAVLALASNAVHKLWKWFCSDQNATKESSVPASASNEPLLWKPSSSSLPLTNEMSDINTDVAVHCFALAKNDAYMVSSSGKKISLFNLITFKTMATFMVAPPAATSVAFHPKDNNIIAVGMEDSTIQIYNVRFDEVKFNLRQHQKRITGLAFSSVQNILISSGADTQLCAWGLDGWEMKANAFLQVPTGQASNIHSDTKVQFHLDQVQLLVIHEAELATYDAKELNCLNQWMPQDGLITHATYSSDGQLIYATLRDGSVNIFTGSLRLRCRINPTAYQNSQLSGYALVVAAHPSNRNQFAMGLTDGHVIIIEPVGIKW